MFSTCFFKLIIDHFILKVYSLGVAGEKLVVATAGRKVFQRSIINVVIENIFY